MYCGMHVGPTCFAVIVYLYYHRYTAMSGTKDQLENYSFLPTTIVRMDGRKPVIAQWNYRIICHPLKNDLPLNRFRAILDESQKEGFGTSTDYSATDRGLRFRLNAFDTDWFKDGHLMHQLLDKLMGEIPGKDNYPAQVIGVCERMCNNSISLLLLPLLLDRLPVLRTTSKTIQK